MSGFEDRMEQLRARFILRAQDEQAAIATAVAAMDRDEVKRIAHGLSGSAGVFGFAEIGNEAQAVEEAVDENAASEDLRGLCAILIDSLGKAGQRP